MGTQLPKIFYSSLTRRTQRFMKPVRIFEKIDNFAKQDDFPTPEISARNLETSEKILPEINASTTPKSAKVNISTALISLFNSSSETSLSNTFKTEKKNENILLDHKEESLWNDIRGKWSAGEYREK
ncbi:unnamed protein product [Rhizophagus irregularis]|nr:unnamed protein product [Rhizophagus irregularis]